jgi:hypothetical protein
MAPAPPARRFAPDDALRLLCIAWIVCELFAWWAFLERHWGNDELMIARDYYCVVRGGELWWSGENPYWYGPPHRDFYNTPAMLPFAVALAPLGIRGGYAAMAALGTIGFAIGVAALSHLGDASPRQRGTVAFVAATAPAFVLALHLGQLSGVWLAILAGSLALLSVRRDQLAGAVAALLLAKPQYAIPLVLACVVLRRWTFVRAFAALAAIEVAVSLAFGLDVWARWWEAARALEGRLENGPAGYWRQQSLFWFFRAATHSSLAAKALWAASALGLGAAILRALLRLRERSTEPAIWARIASVIVLSTCALNGYFFYYDLVLLAVPAAALFLARASWSSALAHRVAIACAAISWALQIEVFWGRDHPPVGGLVAAIWLGVELADLNSSRAAGASREGDRDTPPRGDSRTAHR